MLAASGTGTWRWDMSSGVVEWDETLEALSGLRPGTFGSTYEAWVATLHPDEVESILELVNDAIERRGSYHFEHRAMWPDGSERWLECRGQVTTDADGTATGTVGCAVDITDRRVADDLRDIAFQRERRLRDRFEFLVGLNDIAAAAHTHVEFLAAAARAAVPKLGDWCSIHFRPERDRPCRPRWFTPIRTSPVRPIDSPSDSPTAPRDAGSPPSWRRGEPSSCRESPTV